MRSRLVLALLLSLLSSLSSVAAEAQEFTARVDRTKVAANETLTLEVVYADRADTSAIDFEALLPDFTILANNPSSQTRIVNFKRTSRTSWQLTLMPRRLGRLRIPPFEIGGQQTRPIEILAVEAPESPEEGAPFSVAITSDREQAFVGEQILIRIRLTSSQQVSNLRGSALDLPNAEIKLVNQSEFQRVVGETPYQITDLLYTVFPNRSGEISIPSLQYSGTLRRSQLVVARTKPTRIAILDPALDPDASRNRPWLPASAIAMDSDWSDSIDTLEVGQPITRTVRITAASQRAAAIAPLSLPDGPYKQYAEQPVLEDAETKSGILGRRSEAIVLIPTQPGELTIPPIEINWWNIDEHRWQVARLPAETLRVLDAARQSQIEPEAGDQAPTLPASQTMPKRDHGPYALSITLGVLCVFLSIICIVLWTRLRRLEGHSSSQQGGFLASTDESNERAAFGRVTRSLSKANPQEARRTILEWARIKFPTETVTRLDQLARIIQDDVLSTALAALDAELYRATDDQPSDDYLELEARLKQLLAQERDRIRPPKRDADDSLTRLYPDQG